MAALAPGRAQNWLHTPDGKIQKILDKVGVTNVQFKNETGYDPSELTGSEIQGYILHGKAGLPGYLSRFPTRTSETRNTGTPQTPPVNNTPNGPLFSIKDKGIKALTGEETAKRGMLRVASVDKNGVVKADGVGYTHYDITPIVNVKTERRNNTGFVTPDGKYLTRQESLQWLKKNRPAEIAGGKDKTRIKEAIARCAGMEGYLGR